MLIDNRKLGEQGETVALNFLLTKGYTLIDRNYRAMRCEIDLIPIMRSFLLKLKPERIRDTYLAGKL